MDLLPRITLREKKVETFVGILRSLHNREQWEERMGQQLRKVGEDTWHLISSQRHLKSNKFDTNL